MMYQDIHNCICQNTKKNEDILSIMSNLQPKCCLKIDFQKMDQHAGGKWLIHDTKRSKDNQLQSLKLPCRISKLSSYLWHKVVRWHHLESDILKKSQGQKHPGSWGIVEHQLPSIKVLFKINVKSHKHPGIKLLSSESKTQLVNQRKQKVTFNPGTAHSPEIQSYGMWWGAASPILNETPVACIYVL